MQDKRSKPDTNIDHLAAFLGFLALVAAIIGLWIPGLNQKNEKINDLIEEFDERAEFLYRQPHISCTLKSSYELPSLFFNSEDFSYTNILLSVKTGQNKLSEIVLLINSQDVNRKLDVSISPFANEFVKEMNMTAGKTRVVFNNIEEDIDITIDVRTAMDHDTIQYQVYCKNATILSRFNRGDYSSSINVGRVDYYKLDPVQIDDIRTIEAIIDSLNEHQVLYLYLYNQFMKPLFLLGLVVLSVICIGLLIYL